MKKEILILISIVLIVTIIKIMTHKKTVHIDKQISDNFNLKEFSESNTATILGIDNTIPKKYYPNIEYLVYNILQPLRDFMKSPIKITSGFRSEKLNNSLIGSSKTSDHRFGFAADIKTEDNKKAFDWIKDNCYYDQLIWEKGDNSQPDWLHISVKPDKYLNRNEILFL